MKQRISSQSRRRSRVSYIVLGMAAFCVASSTWAVWRAQAASMTLEQAIETVRNSREPEQRRSAIAAMSALVRDAIDALRAARDDAATEQYATIVLDRIQAAAAEARK